MHPADPPLSPAARGGTSGSPTLLPIMLLMGLYLVIVQINRSGGAVMGSELMAARGFRPAEVGAIIGSMFLASAVVQLPAGVLYDRFGPRVMLSSLNLVAVVGLFIFAFVATVPGLTFARFLIGIGHGTVIAGIYLLAVAWLPADRVATVAGAVVGVAGGVGAMLSTTPLAVVLDRVGFGVTFTAIAIVTLAFSVAIYAVVRDGPTAARGGRGTAEGLWQSLRGLWEVASDRNLLPIYVMGSCFTAPFLTIGGLWAGPYLRDVHGLSGAQSSYVLLAMMLALYAGYTSYGPLDRIFNSRKRVVLGGVVAMLLCLIPLATMTLPLSAAIVLLVLFAICSPFYITLAAHCRGFVPVHRVGRAIACINLTGLLTVFVLQAVAGILVERLPGADGYRAVFAMVAGVLLATALVYSRVRDVPVRPAGQA